MQSRPSPIDLRYVHGQELPGGAHFVVLPTLDALDRHWASIRHTMPFAAHGNCPGLQPRYLRPNEWIFAPTRPALIEAALHWTAVGIEAVWYDWKSDRPEEYQYYFRERERTRQHRISYGAWTSKDEEKYLLATQRKNPENFSGWWRLVNLPYNQTHETWFSGLLDEPNDPLKPMEEVVSIFQYQTYVDWKYQCLDEVIFLDSIEVEAELMDSPR